MGGFTHILFYMSGITLT